MVGLARRPQIVDHHFGRFPTVTVIVSAVPDGQQVTLRAGVDTFAETSVIGCRLASRLNLSQNPATISLVSIDGHNLTVSGEGEVAIRLGEGEHEREARIPVSVVPSLQLEEVDMLLGLSAQLLLGGVLMIDLNRNQVRFTGSRTIGSVRHPMGANRKISLPLERKNFAFSVVEKDFDLFFENGSWSFEWRWACENPELPAGLPAIYKKRFLTEEILDVAREELSGWIDNSYLKYVGEVSRHPDRRWVPVNLVLQPHKQTTPVRVTLDLTSLNKLVKISEEKSTNEVCHESLLKFRRLSHGYVIDVRKAYLQVGVRNPGQRAFLTIKIDDSLYEMAVLPFGLNIGPKVLYKILSLILEDHRESASWYRDDIFCQSESSAEEIRQVLRNSGFETKEVEFIGPGMLHPVKLLGLTVFTDEHGRLVWQRLPKVQDDWKRRSNTAKEFASWINRILQSPVAGWLRPFGSLIKSQIGKFASERSWTAVVPDGHELVKLADIVETRIAEENPMHGIWAVPDTDTTVEVYTDASDTFLGVVIGVRLEGMFYPLYDYCRAVLGKHQINLMELDAVSWGLQLAIDLGFKHLKFKCDSHTVVSWVGRTLSDENLKISGLYAKLAERRLAIVKETVSSFNLTVVIDYVNTTENHADVLTRVSTRAKSSQPRVVAAVREGLTPAPTSFRRWRAGQIASAGELIKMLHQELIHPSDKRMVHVLTDFDVEVTPETRRLIADESQQCSQCALKRARLVPWTSTGTAHRPGECFIDSFTCNNDGFITYVHAEARTIWLEVFEGSANSAVVAKGMLSYIALYGPPEVVRSDNGAEFAGLDELLSPYGTIVRRGAVAHPQSQGLVERVHRTILSLIRLQAGEKRNWVHKVYTAAFTYLRNPHAGLGGLSPLRKWGELITGQDRDLRDMLSSVTEEEETEVADDEIAGLTLEIDSSELQPDVHISQQPSEYEVGDRILWRDPNAIKTKAEFPWKRGTVTKVLGRGGYEAMFTNKRGHQRKRHINTELMARDTVVIPEARKELSSETEISEVTAMENSLEQYHEAVEEAQGNQEEELTLAPEMVLDHESRIPANPRDMVIDRRSQRTRKPINRLNL